MKVAVNPSAVAPVDMSALIRQRLSDYLVLTKPRIAVMVLITVAVGYLIAAGSNARILTLIHTLIGTGLVAGAASAWNMWIERYSDARMRRTENRPLPAGRLNHLEVVVVGTMMAVTGVNYLINALPSPAAALVAAMTFVTYVIIYTPLKQVTTWNTVIGAVPGALPPVIGYCAATGGIDWMGICLFLVLFTWQLPHFMAIAWMYRTEYAKAGHRMLPSFDPTGYRTSRAMIVWCLFLIASTLIPLFLNRFDAIYGIGALLLGIYFLASTIKFTRERTDKQARQVLKASIFYLPGIMAMILLHVFVTG
jgi:protoheme IX farnesyltransferase